MFSAPRGEQESSDLPSLVRKTIKSNGTHPLCIPLVALQIILGHNFVREFDVHSLESKSSFKV